MVAQMETQPPSPNPADLQLTGDDLDSDDDDPDTSPMATTLAEMSVGSVSSCKPAGPRAKRFERNKLIIIMVVRVTHMAPGCPRPTDLFLFSTCSSSPFPFVAPVHRVPFSFPFCRASPAVARRSCATSSNVGHLHPIPPHTLPPSSPPHPAGYLNWLGHDTQVYFFCTYSCLPSHCGLHGKI